jgi:glycosyltransferase involved in cell wall biosynthesis
LPSAWLAFLALSGRVRRLKGSLDFDLIHAHSACLDGPAAVWLGRLVRTPVVCTMHGSDVNLLPQRSRLTRIAARHVIRNADALVAVSSAMQEKALSIGGIEREIEVIPNGVDVQLFRPGDRRRARATLGVPDRVKMLVYLSRLDEMKGLSHIVSAFKTVMGSGVDGRLYLVGEGPFRRHLEEQVTQLGLEQRVILAGLRPHSEIPLWIQACDLVVHPSLSEGSPLPIYEALACGRPLVASRVGGIPELITGDDYGLLVPPGDTRALAAALNKGLEKTWDRQAIRSYGVQYSWARVADRLIDLYRATLEKRQLCSTAFGLEKAAQGQ